MRTKKHALSLLMALAMVVSLAACGGGDKNTNDNDNSADPTPSISGTYNLTKVDMNGVSMDIAQVSEKAGVEVKVALIMNEDGNFSLDLSALGTNEKLAGTWKEDGSNVILTTEGQDISATLNGSTLTMEQDGQSLTFEKE